MARLPTDTTRGKAHPDFAAEIRKTGFVLENRIAEELKVGGWYVISNKYYVDDLEDAVREIDLVAYRVSLVGSLQVYTTLIISCKKSESNAWAFLGRTLDLTAPNSDWWPLHAWSNDKTLTHTLGQTGSARAYHDDVIGLGVTEVLKLPEIDVFAFQEMDKRTGVPHNDKAIFSAITSLMKAQAHELGALPARRKKPAMYQFNLLSVVDSDLVRLSFSKNDIEAKAIDAEQYIARYIINGKDTFARTRFVTPSRFSRDLADYERLHRANCKWVKGAIDKFYVGVMEDESRRSVFADAFRDEVGWFLSYRASTDNKAALDAKRVALGWNGTDRIVRIEVDVDARTLKFLNGDAEARKRVAAALVKYYKYGGAFEFADYIPF
jgi:hypothetical protein